jgi:hypothetical protein
MCDEQEGVRSLAPLRCGDGTDFSELRSIGCRRYHVLSLACRGCPLSLIRTIAEPFHVVIDVQLRAPGHCAPRKATKHVSSTAQRRFLETARLSLFQSSVPTSGCLYSIINTVPVVQEISGLQDGPRFSGWNWPRCCIACHPGLRWSIER